MDKSIGRKLETPEPESDSTSKKTVADLEQNEKSSADKQGKRNESGIPSPDGSFDEKKETDDAGPM